MILNSKYLAKFIRNTNQNRQIQNQSKNFKISLLINNKISGLKKKKTGKSYNQQI